MRVGIAGLLGVLQLEFTGTGSPVLPVALLIVGSNALIAMLLPYAAESFPLRIRGRTTGTVAACTKAGGMFAQLLAIMALIPALDVVSLIIIVPTIAALILVGWVALLHKLDVPIARTHEEALKGLRAKDRVAFLRMLDALHAAHG